MFAVTTGLPCRERLEDEAAGRLDAADRLDDEIDVRVGDDAMGIAGEDRLVDLDVALGREVAHRHSGDLQPDAGAHLDSVLLRPDELRRTTLRRCHSRAARS